MGASGTRSILRRCDRWRSKKSAVIHSLRGFVFAEPKQFSCDALEVGGSGGGEAHDFTLALFQEGDDRIFIRVLTGEQLGEGAM